MGSELPSLPSQDLPGICARLPDGREPSQRIVRWTRVYLSLRTLSPKDHTRLSTGLQWHKGGQKVALWPEVCSGEMWGGEDGFEPSSSGWFPDACPVCHSRARARIIVLGSLISTRC